MVLESSPEAPCAVWDLGRGLSEPGGSWVIASVWPLPGRRGGISAVDAWEAAGCMRSPSPWPGVGGSEARHSFEGVPVH